MNKVEVVQRSLYVSSEVNLTESPVLKSTVSP